MTHLLARVTGAMIGETQAILRAVAFGPEVIRPQVGILLLARRLDVSPEEAEELVVAFLEEMQSERRHVVAEMVAEGDLRRTIVSTTLSNAVGELLAAAVGGLSAS